MKIESNIVDIPRSNVEIFDFLTDFTHFSLFLPDKVENWQATKDSCRFTVKGLTDFGMKIISTNPYSTITIANDEQVQIPVKFIFTWRLTELTKGCMVQASFDIDINPVMSMMIKKPLSDFANILVAKLKENFSN